MSGTMPADTAEQIRTNPLAEMTGFQRDLLYVIAGKDKPSGQNVLDEIDQYVSKAVTHGRLYPNLDTLVDKGFIEKGELDRRTNFYELTEKGKGALENRREWVNKVTE